MFIVYVTDIMETRLGTMNSRFEIVISRGRSNQRLSSSRPTGRFARTKIFLARLFSAATAIGFLIALLIAGSAIAALILSVLVIIVVLWFLRAAFRRAQR